MMPRTLALDYGSKRIGVAVSDRLGLAAHGVATITYHSTAEAFAEIFRYLQEYEMEQILIGLPLDAEGKEGTSARKVRQFGVALEDFLKQKGLSLPIVWWDESASTLEAETHLIEAADLSRKKRRKVVDKMAAVFILKSYMESQC